VLLTAPMRLVVDSL